MALAEVVAVAVAFVNFNPAGQVSGRSVAAIASEDAAFGINLDVDLAFGCFKFHIVSSL